MAERRQYNAGTWIWIPDEEEVWRKAEVVEIGPNGEVKLRFDECGDDFLLGNRESHISNAEAFSSEGLTTLDDLTQLTHLHEPAVLNSLHVRFDVDSIYTFTGPILIAVNPFKTIPNLYSMDTIKSFLAEFVPDGLIKSAGNRVPHVFATGAQAFRGLCRSKASQTILISGESGAGKTESTKFVMKLLAMAGSKDWNNRSEIENQVLQSNPLLEALGNAKTLRNDNSSRFGKFIEMQFELVNRKGLDMNVGRLAGARIHTYLLETVRVCHQSEGERNYHSFYQVCAAAGSTSGGKYKFPSVIEAEEASPVTFDFSKYDTHHKFRYLTQSSCVQLPRMNDVEEFENTVLAMQTIGISHEDQSAMFDTISAVLYLGNVAFKPGSGNSEGAVIDTGTRSSLEVAAALLKIDARALEHALTHRTITARNETYSIELKIREADDARDGLAKALYGTLFLKMVDSTNTSIGYREDVSLFCGVLDIFGFECFKVNSFEQLCINFTNERLQQFFNTFIFKCEEELYEKEGIPWSALDFPDNKDCVELMSGKGGIFAMLDEECIVPGGTDKAFCNKMKDKHKDDKRFGIIKPKPEWFIVNHFAGPVQYCSDGFLDKNRDQLSVDIQDCIKASQQPYVKSLFTNFLNRGGNEPAVAQKKKKCVTVSGEFCSQLNYLMSTVDLTEPHFIRCLKPNGKNVPDVFERRSVTEQLRYGGVLQAVQVSRAGYPIRMLHAEAIRDYRGLCDFSIKQEMDNVIDAQERAKIMINFLNVKLQFPVPMHSAHSFAVGHTMVFFKYSAYEVLSTAKAQLRKVAATYIQARWRGRQQRLAFKQVRQAAIVVQKYARARAARKRVAALRIYRAASKIQAVWKARQQRKRYLRDRKSAICIQATYRGWLCRMEHLELFREHYAKKIQAAYRRYRCSKHYKQLRRAAGIAQRRWRCICAKRELRRLRMQQREASHLAEKNKALDVRVKQLEEEASTLANENYTLRERLRAMEDDVTRDSSPVEDVKRRDDDNASLTNENEALKKAIKDLEEKLAETKERYMNDTASAEYVTQGISTREEELAKREEAVRAREEALTAGNKNTLASPVSTASTASPNSSPQSPRASTGVSSSAESSVVRDSDGIERTKGALPFPEGSSLLIAQLRSQIAQLEAQLEESRSTDEPEQAEAVRIATLETESETLKSQLQSLQEENASLKEQVTSLRWAAAQQYSRSFSQHTAPKSPHAQQPARTLAASSSIVGPQPAAAPTATVPTSGSALSSIMRSLHTYFVPTDARTIHPEPNSRVLHPSVAETIQPPLNLEGNVDGQLVCVDALPDQNNAITCLAFGRERLAREYYLLAAACKDGLVSVYRVYRTASEMQDWDNGMTHQPQIAPSNTATATSEAEGQTEHVLKLFGHTRAITHMFFSAKEDQLVTTSIDKSVRFWSLDTGDMLKVFADSSACLVAEYLPLNPTQFLVANANAILRVVDSKDGSVLQKLRAESEIRALRFDDAGVYCYAGTRQGVLHVLESSEIGSIKFKFKNKLARASITCITFVPSGGPDRPPVLLVNSCDCHITVVDCVYKHPTGTLSTVLVRRRLRVPQTLLPLRCAYSFAGQGWIISASEDKNVHVYSAGANGNKLILLKKHEAPVVTVATNTQNTLLASADAVGIIHLWRWLTYSQNTTA